MPGHGQRVKSGGRGKPSYVLISEEGQDEQACFLSTADSDLSVLVSRGVRPTASAASAANAHTLGGFSNSSTAYADRGQGYAHCLAPYTHVHAPSP